MCSVIWCFRSYNRLFTCFYPPFFFSSSRQNLFSPLLFFLLLNLFIHSFTHSLAHSSFCFFFLWVGVLAAVHVARAGFPVRMQHGEFVKRYGLLAVNILKETWVTARKDYVDNVREQERAVARYALNDLKEGRGLELLLHLGCVALRCDGGRLPAGYGCRWPVDAAAVAIVS